jgi:hypothetical protein
MTHPITPPPELIEQWRKDMTSYEVDIVRAAQWGAAQELEAIQKEIITQAWFADPGHRLAQLRTARRPKPPSLKEQALEALREAESSGCLYVNGRSDTIRRALEAMPDD